MKNQNDRKTDELVEFCLKHADDFSDISLDQDNLDFRTSLILFNAILKMRKEDQRHQFRDKLFYFFIKVVIVAILINSLIIILIIACITLNCPIFNKIDMNTLNSLLPLLKQTEMISFGELIAMFGTIVTYSFFKK